MKARRLRPKPRGGFTLLEMLMVIGVIAFLVSILAFGYANMVSKAREKATAATIKKINGLLQDRQEAFEREVRKSQAFRTRVQSVQQSLNNQKIYGVSPKAIEILVYKTIYRENFPQRYVEIGSAPPGNNASAADSAELLYAMLTSANVFGMPPVDASEFSSSEVGDTDDDGLLEFIDSWGHPLRFYRWPTRLIRPNGGSVDRSVASLLIQGLPQQPLSGGQRDMLERDPDDPVGVLAADRERLLVASNNTIDLYDEYNPTNYHDRDTYHTPLIVSAGRDDDFGLIPMNDPFGHLAQPTGNTDALTDNITNRNQRAGGN